MSSTQCGRLRLLFQQKPTTTAITAAVTSTSTATNRDRASAASAASDSTSADETSKRDKKIHFIVQEFKEKSSSNHFRRSISAYTGTVRRLAKFGQLSSVHEILDYQKQFPDIKNEKFTARLIVLYGKVKMLDHALKLFDEMPELNCPRTVLSINSIMAACFPSRKFDKVIELFHELPGKLSVKPDVITYGMAVRAHCEMKSWDEALSLFHEIEKNGLHADSVTFGCILRAFYRNGRFSEAENLWSLMEEKNVVPDLSCYNSRLYGMLKENRTCAIDFFKEIKEKGLKPNNYTYNLMVRVFVNEGNLEEVKKWYALMIGDGICPDFITLALIIPFAIEKDIDFAYELLCMKSDVVKPRFTKNVIQHIINKLVEELKVDKAKKLFEIYAWKSGLMLELDSNPSTADQQQ